MGITSSARLGLVSNTATQIQMFRSVGATPPRLEHGALLVGTEGKLSKRLGFRSEWMAREAGGSSDRARRPCSRDWGTQRSGRAGDALNDLTRSIDFARSAAPPPSA